MNLADAYNLCRRRQFKPMHAMHWMRESTYVVRRKMVAIGTAANLEDKGLPHFDAHFSTSWRSEGYDFLLRDRAGRPFRSSQKQSQAYLERQLHSMWHPDDAARGIAAALNTEAGLYLLQRIGGGTKRKVCLMSRSGAAALDGDGKGMLVHSIGSQNPRSAKPEVVFLKPYYLAGELALYTAFPMEKADEDHPEGEDRVLESGLAMPFAKEP